MLRGGSGVRLYCYRWPTLVVWALLLLVALPVAPNVVRALVAGGFTSADLEAARAGELLSEPFRRGAREPVLRVSGPKRALTASDPRFLAWIDQSLANVGSVPAVERVVPPSQSPRQIAPDQQAAYATLALRSDAHDVREILPAIQQALRPTPLEVTLTGAPVFYADISRSPNATCAAPSCCRSRWPPLRWCWCSARWWLASCPV